MDGRMTAQRDILVHCRQQAAVCKAQGHKETHAFLTALANEIEALRQRLKIRVLDAADSVAMDRMNGHG